MPFDAEMLLLDGTANLAKNYTPPVSLTTGAYGAYVRDIRETGEKGLAAILMLPLASVSYTNKMVSSIEVSDSVTFGWETIASFPTFYQYIRRVPALTTTAPVEADVGKWLYGGSTNDDGKVVWFDPALSVASTGAGYIYIAMEAAGDVFDNTSEALTIKAAAAGGGAAGTFVGVVNGVAADAPDIIQPGGKIYVVRFATAKRYVRFNATCTPSAYANFHGVVVGLTSSGFKGGI